MNKKSRYTQEEIDSWGENHKACKTCKKVLPFSEFHKHKECLFGINNVCKACRIPLSKKGYWNKPLEKIMLERAKSRSKIKQLDFNLEISDIFIPDVCPVLGIKLQRGTDVISDSTPTLDRIIPDLGYVKGNVVVISAKANRIKSNANYEELFLVYKWLKSTVETDT